MNTNDVITLVNKPRSALLLTRKQWMVFIRILRHELMLARFAYNFLPYLTEVQDTALQSHLKTHFNNAITIAERQNQSVLFEMQEIKRQLGATSEKLICLKGAAYSLINNSVTKGRTYGDIDLLSPKEDINLVEQHFSIYGWIGKEVNDYDDKYYREWSHEIPPLAHSARGTVIDLHHNLVPPISGRAPDISLFTENSIKTENSRVLRPAAMTLHSIVHLFLNEDFKHGFRNIYDVHLLLTEYDSPEFWHDLYQLATKTGFTLELYLALTNSNKLFSTSINFDVMNELSLEHDGKLINWYWDFIFKAALSPKHSLCQSNKNQLGIFLAYLRGHKLKMPTKTLIKHIVIKSYRYLVESTLGKSFFIEEGNKHG